MRICFSRDRPAQLDLLLRSLERYAPPEATSVILAVSSYDGGYDLLRVDHPAISFNHELPNVVTFDWILRRELERDRTVTFFCDDNVVFRQIPDDPRIALYGHRVLVHSWRLSDDPFVASWDWTTLPRTGHGYPGSIDGHTFRTSDVQEMIGGQVIENPTMLETVLALGCEKLADRRPLMAAWPEQVLVGVPVNRVSETSGCPNGERFPQPVEELNRRFLAGERIALDRLDFSGVDGCHHEIQYEWE